MASLINILSLSDEQKLSIRKLLTIYPKPMGPFGYMNPKPGITLFLIEDGNIVLPFAFVRAFFKITPNIHIKYPKCTIDFTGKLRVNQVSIFQEMMEALERFDTVTLILPPGTGKTLLGVKAAAHYGYMACATFPREFLAEQWDKTIKENSNFKTWIVGGPIPKEANFILALDQRVEKIPKELRKGIGLAIYDEAHMQCTSGKVSSVLGFTPRKVIILTATPNRQDGLESILHAIAGTHCVTRKHEDPFNVLHIMTGVIPDLKKQDDWSELTKTIAFSDDQNKIILSLVRDNKDKRILILTGLVDHVKYLHGAVVKMGISTDWMAGTKGKYNNCHVLVANVQKIGTGFDAKTCCSDYDGVPFNYIIIAWSIKLKTMLEQNVGRGFRADNPTIAHLVGDHYILEKHWKSDRPWYLANQGKITDYIIEKIPDIEIPEIPEKYQIYKGKGAFKKKNLMSLADIKE